MEWIENKQEMELRGYFSVLEREDSLYKIFIDKPSMYWIETNNSYYIEYSMDDSYYEDYTISLFKYNENTDEWTISIISRFAGTYEEMKEIIEILKMKYEALE